MNKFQSWGNYPQVKNQDCFLIPSRMAALPLFHKSVLPRGLGRSYGDSCLNENGVLLDSKSLNHFIFFDKQSGLLKCESGITFEEIIEMALPQGWFLPVTPGTKFVTVGGAIANDVHGKNHHVAGNFGHHVKSFELVRSDGSRVICSPEINSELFYASIGGLGLTGVIAWAEIQLKKTSSAWIEQEQIQFSNLQDFFKLSKDSEKDFEYTVAWVDCVNSKNGIRGIFIRGNHAQNHPDNFRIHNKKGFKSVPFPFPEFALNKLFIKLFNHIYFRKNLTSFKKNTVHYEPFFYPLDSIHNWNRIYGKRGFLQYQFVVPYENDNGKALEEIFEIIRKSQMGSFLAVLKTFGSQPSLGCLSFPEKGVTLALDFPNYGEKLFRVLDQCDQIVSKSKGRIYPAKDARMSKATFLSSFQNVAKLENLKDPKFSSSFWRRVR